MDLTKLLNSKKLVDPRSTKFRVRGEEEEFAERIKCLSEVKLANLFFRPLTRLLPDILTMTELIPKQSPLYTKEQIAEILIKNKLVSNLEEALRETESLIEKKLSVGYNERHCYKFIPLSNSDGAKRYQLRMVWEFYPR